MNEITIVGNRKIIQTYNIATGMKRKTPRSTRTNGVSRKRQRTSDNTCGWCWRPRSCASRGGARASTARLSERELRQQAAPQRQRPPLFHPAGHRHWQELPVRDAGQAPGPGDQRKVHGDQGVEPVERPAHAGGGQPGHGSGVPSGIHSKPSRSSRPQDESLELGRGRRLKVEVLKALPQKKYDFVMGRTMLHQRKAVLDYKRYTLKLTGRQAAPAELEPGVRLEGANSKLSLLAPVTGTQSCLGPAATCCCHTVLSWPCWPLLLAHRLVLALLAPVTGHAAHTSCLHACSNS